MNDFYDVIKHRRSNYTIEDRQIVSPDRIEEILNTAIVHTPAAFNQQPARVAALFGDNHIKLWDIVWETLQETAPPENLKNTKRKLDNFAAGYGTILFFNDENTIQSLEQQFPLFADAFPSFALQSTGMLQYVIWCALDNEGLGVSLQHYNPPIDARVKREWNIPESWQLLSQMVLGSPAAPPVAKQFIDPSDKLTVFR